MTADVDPTHVRLEEVLDDVRTLEESLPDCLTVGPAIRSLETTLEVYERLGFDGIEARSGDRREPRS